MNKHLHPSVLENIQNSEKNGGIDLRRLAYGTRIEAQTRNSLYTIIAKDDEVFEVQGGSHFPEAHSTHIQGSTWGGSMLKLHWIGIGMHIEIWHPSKGNIVTTAVRSLKIIAPDNSWSYELQ